jgi:hypothetical protein
MTDKIEDPSIEDITIFSSNTQWIMHRSKATIIAIIIWSIITLISWLWISEFITRSRGYSHKKITILIILDVAFAAFYAMFIHKHVFRSENKFTGVEAVSRQRTAQEYIEATEEETDDDLIAQLRREIARLQKLNEELHISEDMLKEEIKKIKDRCVADKSYHPSDFQAYKPTEYKYV